MKLKITAMVDTIIYQKDRNNIRRKVTKRLSFVMCLMFKNIKLIFQNTNDRILIIITNWCLECALRGDTGGRVDVVRV